MEFQPVESSNISAIGHHEGVLGIRFKSGAEYHYQNVDDALFAEISGAASIGRTLNQLIKAKPEDYPYARVV